MKVLDCGCIFLLIHLNLKGPNLKPFLSASRLVLCCPVLSYSH